MFFRNLRSSWKHKRENHHITLRKGDRRFVLTVPKTYIGYFDGHLEPLPGLHGTRSGSARTAASAHLNFVIIGETVGKFHGVGVPDEYHRQGWASDMVIALLDHYPNVHFYNTSLNKMSGPLFVKLSAERPNQIAPVALHDDGDYMVDTSWRPTQDR